VSIFNERELELCIGGMPSIQLDDLMVNTEYHTYTATSRQIRWFWNVLRGFTAEDLALFLQFVTGTSKVPLDGFASLQGMRGVQKFNIHKAPRGGLPTAHTCFNQLDLPEYDSEAQLSESLLTAIRECSVGFGFG
jgi:E3 ubiquitin-protein ligase HUWE1